MTKKKHGPNVEELLGRPWCYYCERDFEDLKMLISHQKAKHFKCERCNKRLNTAGGLSVHMNQVHKETLNQVENALPNREGLDIEIFGMEGVPEDIIQQHTQRILQSFYTAQAERQAATGNPPAGRSRDGPRKPVKDLDETPESIKSRLKIYMAKNAERRAKAAAAGNPPVAGVPPSPAANGGVSGQMPPSAGVAAAQGSATLPPGGYPYPVPGGIPGAPAPYGQQPPGAFTGSLPARPPAGTTPPAGLPARPSFYSGGNDGMYVGPNAAAAAAGSGGDQAMQKPGGDDIDQLIRMAEAGIRPGQPGGAGKADEASAAGGAAAEKKSKKEKEKNVRMVYNDSEISPEERMASMPRYAKYLTAGQG